MDQTSGAGSTSGRRGRLRTLIGAACATVMLSAGTLTVTEAHADPIPSRPVVTTNQTGTHDGYFYAFWQDTGDAAMTLGPGGRYSARWSAVNNWFGGKGWAVGGRRTFAYCGTFHPGGVSYLALFGYTTDPYVEYYIMDNWGSYRPTGTRMGAVVSVHGTYDIYRVQLMGTPETPPRYQYFSVRQQKRSSGIIDTGEHFDAWARAGMNLGTMGYMIMATEGYHSSGWSDITVDGVTTGPSRCTAGPPSTP